MFRLSCMMKSNKKAMSVPQKKFLCEILIAPLSDINDSLIIILCKPLILFTLHNYMSTIKPLSFIIKLFHNKIIFSKEKAMHMHSFLNSHIRIYIPLLPGSCVPDYRTWRKMKK